MSPSSSFWYKAAARTWCHSKWSQDETLQEDLHFSIQEASLWTDPGYRQLEAGEPPFIKPDVQKILELQISKRVELKLWKEQGRESFDHALSCVGDMLQSCSSCQVSISSFPPGSYGTSLRRTAGSFTGASPFFTVSPLWLLSAWWAHHSTPLPSFSMNSPLTPQEELRGMQLHCSSLQSPCFNTWSLPIL